MKLYIKVLAIDNYERQHLLNFCTCYLSLLTQKLNLFYQEGDPLGLPPGTSWGGGEFRGLITHLVRRF